MPTLKVNPASGKLRAKEWYHAETPTTPWYPLSADCDICTSYPAGPVASGFVFLGQQSTYTASASGSCEKTGSWSFDPSSSGAQAGLSCFAGAGSVSFAYDDGCSPMRPHLHLSGAVTGGSNSGIIIDLPSREDDPKCGFPLTFSVALSCPIRLFARIKELTRYDKNGNFWGPNTDTVDLRGYKSADVQWWYWPDDGPVTITISCSTASGASGTHTVTFSPPTCLQVTAGGTATLSRYDDAGTLTAGGWIAPQLPSGSQTIWAPDPWQPGQRGAIFNWGGASISGAATGTDTDAQMFGLSLQGEPPRSIDFSVDLRDGAGGAWSGSALSVIPTSGPDWSGTLLDCSGAVCSQYPVGTNINLTAPGRYQGNGHAWVYSGSCLLDGSNAGVSGSEDTIGTPAFGFALSPTALASANQDNDAWRIVLPIPATAATWKAFRIWQQPDRPLDSFGDGWTALSGTAVTGEANALHLAGSGWIGIERTVSTGYGLTRYLRLSATPDSGTLQVRLTAGARSWTRSLADSGVSVVYDLLAPAEASAPARVQGVLEATGGPDWGWGIIAGENLKIEASGPITLHVLKSIYLSEQSLLHVSESIHANDSRYKAGTDGTGTYYARRMLVWLPDGRVALDLPGGCVYDGIGSSGEDVAVAFSLQQMHVLARTALSGGLTVMENAKPATGGAVYSCGVKWWQPGDFFCNRVEAYHLRPMLDGGAWPARTAKRDIYANYCVDRIAPGVGVNLALTITKWLGGCTAGVLLDTDRVPVADTLSITPGARTATAAANGLWGAAVAPGEDAVVSAPGGLVGDPVVVTGTLQGTLTRLSVVET